MVKGEDSRKFSFSIHLQHGNQKLSWPAYSNASTPLSKLIICKPEANRKMAAEDDDNGAFNLDGGDSASFQSKKTDVFGSLDALEKRYQSKVAARAESDNKRDSEESRNGFDRDEVDGEREFKRPHSPKVPRRNDFRSKAWSRRGDFGHYRNRKPDFEMNPEKWKKYSLEDTEVCGNAQNSRVAFDMIRQLRQRREEAEGLGEGSQKVDLDQKIVFAKPTLKTSASSKSEKQKSTFGSVHKMPEFNFGKRDRKMRSRGQNSEQDESMSGRESLSLEHLDNEPGDDLDVTDQSENRSEIFDQSDNLRPERNDDSGTFKGEVQTAVSEQTDHVSSEEASTSVAFKKRRGKRNIRSRQDEETD